MREKLNYHENADDGTFWMDYNFAKYIFEVFTVGTRIEDEIYGTIYSNLKVTQSKSSISLISIYGAYFPGTYTFSIC
jgi:hypothetical protein